MLFPDQLKLGKAPDPANVGYLNKHLQKARGIIIFIYQDGIIHTYAHGGFKCIDYIASIRKLIDMAGCIKYEEAKKNFAII